MAITLRNHAFGNSAAAGGSQGVTVTSTTAGDTLVVLACCAGNTTHAVSDNGASHATWVQVENTVFDATANLSYSAWAAYNVPAAITSVTVTYGASSANRTTSVTAWSGTASSAAFDQGPGEQTQTSATPASASITPTQNNEVVMGWAISTGGNALTTGGGFTSIDNGNTGVNFRAEYIVQTNAGAQTLSYTCTSQYVICNALSFATSPVSGGGTTGNPLIRIPFVRPVTVGAN